MNPKEIVSIMNTTGPRSTQKTKPWYFGQVIGLLWLSFVTHGMVLTRISHPRVRILSVSDTHALLPLRS